MIQLQELPKYAPYFGIPKALRRQNRELETMFSEGKRLPVNVAETLDRFWKIYDSVPEQIGSELTRVEIGKLTWCFALERDGRRILDGVNTTFALLALIQQRYRSSYLHGLRYSFFHGYKPGSTAFELFRSAFLQMLIRLDLEKPNHKQWKHLLEILPAKSHTVLARRVISTDIAYNTISQRFNIPEDSVFCNYICDALVDVLISTQRVRDKARSLFDFLAQKRNLNTIKYGIEQLLFYYHRGNEQDKSTSYIDGALVDFVLEHLGDIRASCNRLYWTGIDQRAQGIFLRWLVTSDLEIFFSHIVADQERKAFWLEYLAGIECSRLVVGKETKRDAERFMSHERYAELIDGNAGQNAIILKVGELVVVELCGSESLRYVYHERTTPFTLNNQAYQIAELCHSSALFKQYLKKGWQVDFATTLHNHFGIYRYQSRRYSAMA